jgi:predicted  nucleic acid-binding Zn-ribbon protein
MVNMDITMEEKEIMMESIETAVSNLGLEIADTDKREFKDGLKTKKAALMKILEQLKN